MTAPRQQNEIFMTQGVTKLSHLLLKLSLIYADQVPSSSGCIRKCIFHFVVQISTRLTRRKASAYPIMVTTCAPYHGDSTERHAIHNTDEFKQKSPACGQSRFMGRHTRDTDATSMRFCRKVGGTPVATCREHCECMWCGVCGSQLIELRKTNGGRCGERPTPWLLCRRVS